MFQKYVFNINKLIYFNSITYFFTEINIYRVTTLFTRVHIFTVHLVIKTLWFSEIFFVILAWKNDFTKSWYMFVEAVFFIPNAIRFRVGEDEAISIFMVGIKMIWNQWIFSQMQCIICHVFILIITTGRRIWPDYSWTTVQNDILLLCNLMVLS